MTKQSPKSPLAPVVPYVEAHHTRGKQKRPTLVVIRISHTTSVRGAALGVATQWHNPRSVQDSCHYVVDESSIYRCVPDNVGAYHGFQEPFRVLSVNVCAEPTNDGRVWQTPHRVDAVSKAAGLVAELLHIYKIPARYLSIEQETKWSKRKLRRRGGIVVMVHGVWPHRSFLEDVRHRLEVKRRSK